jgi:outer membrane cobalamin receptor
MVAYVHVYAQTSQENSSFVKNKDTLQTFTTKSIIKHANGSIDTLNRVPLFSYIKLHSQDIQSLSSRRLDAIVALIPSADLRDYGGPGSLKLISNRGLGPQRSVILIDGIALTSPQNGMFDIGTLPIVDNQEYIVQKGGFSTIAGSGAIGGLINIHLPFRNIDNHALLHSSIGSFGERSLKGSYQWGNSTSHYFFHSDYLSYDGSFPFQFQPAGFKETIEMNRQNAQSSSLHVFARAALSDTLDKHSFSAFTMFRQTKRGVPGAVLSGKIEDAQAVFSENESLTAFHYTLNRTTLPRLHSSCTIKKGVMTFNDPFAKYAGKSGIQSTFLNSEYISTTSFEYEILNEILMQSSFQCGYTSLSGEMLQPDAGNNPSRRFAAFSTTAYYQYELFKCESGIRADFFSGDIGNANSAFVSAGYILSDNFLIKSKISKDFRAPSFNELYYLNYGTSQLKPEHSINIEAGLAYRSLGRSVDLDIYSIDLTNQIFAIPISPLQWSARNIGQTHSSGLECTFQDNISISNLHVRAAYSYRKVVDNSADSFTKDKQLPYTPKHQASSSISYHLPSYFFGLSINYTGSRYSLPDNNSDSELTDFFLLSVFAEKQIILFDITTIVRLDIRNVLNTRYEMIDNYPLPGFSLLGSISMRI